MTLIDSILSTAASAGASDVHLTAERPPRFRVDTIIRPAPLPPMSAGEVEQVAKQLLGAGRWEQFVAVRDADFAYSFGDHRCRVNAHFERGRIALSFRLISRTIRSLDELGLPPVVTTLAGLSHGLVLVTGGTGSGKSSTLAGMVDHVNRHAGGNIVTLEDPIEYLFTDDKACIRQREVGSDVTDFAAGLRHVLRQDPDVIMVGEMRDLETTAAALTAAETGHLVLSSLHTSSAPSTVDRVIDVFPTGQQNQVRSMLAGSLQAVVTQTLLKRRDGGLVPAAEVLICTPAVRHCIRENRSFEIPNLIETGRAAGMQSLDTAIRQLVVAGVVSREEGMSHATQPDRLRTLIAA